MELIVFPQDRYELALELREKVKYAQILKSGGTSVYRVNGFTVKITRVSRIRKTRVLPYFFGPSKGYREFKNISLLRKNGFTTPRPILYWEIKQHGVILESGFVEEFIENLIPVREELKNRRQVSFILHSLGKLFRRLHDDGFFMRDLTYGNFFLKDKEIVMVDVSRMLYLHQPLALFLRLEDLSKVDSDGDDLRKLLTSYWESPAAVNLSFRYITMRKKIRRIRKKITHSLKI